MTAQILQEELVKEIGVIFRDDLFKDSAGEYIKMNVYEQNLPIRQDEDCLLYTSPSPRDMRRSRMPSSA